VQALIGGKSPIASSAATAGIRSRRGAGGQCALFILTATRCYSHCRPVILNGIEDIVTRPDLAERSLFLTLQAILVEQRRAEKELYAAFEEQRPFILGAFLDAVAHGLKQLPHTKLGEPPRMADFALWAAACETAMWPAGTFAAAYKSNLDEAIENVAEADPVSATVRVLVSGENWSGTATELMAALAEKAGERTAKAKEWPGNPRALSGRLRRVARSFASLASRSISASARVKPGTGQF
jgi:hypothetical protein